MRFTVGLIRLLAMAILMTGSLINGEESTDASNLAKSELENAEQQVEDIKTSSGDDDDDNDDDQDQVMDDDYLKQIEVKSLIPNGEETVSTTQKTDAVNSVSLDEQPVPEGQDIEDEINNLMDKNKRNYYYYNKDKPKNREKGKNRKLKAGKTGRKGRKKGKGRKQRQKQKQETAQADAGLTSNNIIDYDDELTSTTTEKPRRIYHSCAELQCKSGGKCVPDELRGGFRCQCLLGTSGDLCDRELMVKYPKFMGTGYLAFPVLRGAFKEFKISIEFRPDVANGLLLFSGEHPSARSDFFSVSLIDGYAEFRFDCGTGAGILRTDNTVKLGEWNTVTLHRSDYHGWIQLNDGSPKKGRSKGVFSRITFREDLFLGGYSNASLIGDRVGMQWGFVGCVHRLEVNGRVYDMRKGPFVGDAVHGVDVGECSNSVCDNTKCLNGGTCAAESADSAVCLCPVGTDGDHCETRIDIHVPSFSGQSYLQFFGLRRTVLSFIEVEVVFKPASGDGLIFYNGYTTDRTGDFISLALRRGFVEFRFDLGTGPAIIRSQEPLTMDEWHVVRFSRTGRDGWLQVDNQAAVEGMSKGAFTQLTLTLDLFIGGHRNYDEVAKNAAVHQSFTGCIQKVDINRRPLKLIEEAVMGVNVDNCNHPCVGQPCQNGGRCVAIKDFYECLCPLGFESTNCEERAARFRYRYRYRREISEPITVPMFSGESYLKYTNHHMISRVRGLKNDIQMRVRALGPDGLLFWTGESDMTSLSDYLALGLKEGHVVFSFNLGSGEVNITFNLTRIDDGQWHWIRAQRYEKVGYLEIDGTEVVEGNSPGSLKQLNPEAIIYLGGMNDVGQSTVGKYATGFTGCISNLTLATDYKVNLMGEVKQGINVEQCRADRTITTNDNIMNAPISQLGSNRF